MTDWYTDLRHPSAQKRIEAVRALVKADHPHALDLLRDAYRQETDPDVKEIIKRAGNYLRASSTGSASVPPKQAKAPAASRSSSVNIYDVTWRQARSRIFLFGGALLNKQGKLVNWIQSRQEGKVDEQESRLPSA